MELRRYNLYNIATKFIRLYIIGALRRLQRRHLVRKESAIGTIKIGRYINIIYKDRNQKKVELYDRNRKEFPLFTNTTVKYYN